MNKNRADIDRRIIERSKRDSNCFADMYRRYEPRVFAFFQRRVNSQEIAKDLTQETFTKAFGSLHRFDHRGYSYSSYLFTIARNLLVNHYRKKKTVSLEEMESSPSFTPSYQQRFDSGLVWGATKDMSPTERLILEERYKKGKTIREIAGIVNKSENAVNSYFLAPE
ncbi:MAG: RNA polymerase sigma factor, partial [Patescibacteria group bacterium]